MDAKADIALHNAGTPLTIDFVIRYNREFYIESNDVNFIRCGAGSLIITDPETEATLGYVSKCCASKDELTATAYKNLLLTAKYGRTAPAMFAVRYARRRNKFWVAHSQVNDVEVGEVCKYGSPVAPCNNDHLWISMHKTR